MSGEKIEAWWDEIAEYEFAEGEKGWDESEVELRRVRIPTLDC